jgi:hypothetical protein
MLTTTVTANVRISQRRALGDQRRVTSAARCSFLPACHNDAMDTTPTNGR